MLARTARWAKQHESTFRFGRMVGGNPAKGEIYGFSSFDGSRGTLALRNPDDKSHNIHGTLADLLLLPDATVARSLRLDGIYGKTKSMEGSHQADSSLALELPALEIALFEVQLEAAAD